MSRRRYNYYVMKKSDGMWVAYYPGVDGLSPIEADSLRKIKKLSRQALISFLQKCVQDGQPPPGDRIKRYFHEIDINRLMKYPGLGDSMGAEIR